jgi:hypothetical protein
MIGATIMHPRQPGPCVICGCTDYDLSCGGPTICPKCDCGNFDSATVMQQAKVIADLRKQIQALTNPAQAAPDAVRSALEIARKRIEYFGEITDQRHQEANEQYFLPPIDRALAALSSVSSTDRAAPPSVALDAGAPNWEEVAQRAKVAGDRVLQDAKVSPEQLRRPYFSTAHNEFVTKHGWPQAAPPSVALEAGETWAYIERLLHDECGLRLDEGLGGQRANCINAIRNGNNTDPALLAAAVEFLNSGEGLHKIRVNGKMMDRKAVAAALTRPQPGGAVAGTDRAPPERGAMEPFRCYCRNQFERSHCAYFKDGSCGRTQYAAVSRPERATTENAGDNQ